MDETKVIKIYGTSSEIVFCTSDILLRHETGIIVAVWNKAQALLYVLYFNFKYYYSSIFS